MVIAVLTTKMNVLEEIVKMTETLVVTVSVEKTIITKDVGVMHHVLHSVIVVTTTKKYVTLLVTAVTDVSIFAETTMLMKDVIVIPRVPTTVIAVTTTKKNALVPV
jgi:hypothetical protein